MVVVVVVMRREREGGRKGGRGGGRPGGGLALYSKGLTAAGARRRPQTSAWGCLAACSRTWAGVVRCVWGNVSKEEEEERTMMMMQRGLTLERKHDLP